MLVQAPLVMFHVAAYDVRGELGQFARAGS